jgi:hypothetical protein
MEKSMVSCRFSLQPIHWNPGFENILKLLFRFISYSVVQQQAQLNPSVIIGSVMFHVRIIHGPWVWKIPKPKLLGGDWNHGMDYDFPFGWEFRNPNW